MLVLCNYICVCVELYNLVLFEITGLGDDGATKKYHKYFLFFIQIRFKPAGSVLILYIDKIRGNL